MSGETQPRHPSAIGKYHLVRLVGEWRTAWARGSSFLAHDEKLDREVLVKILSAESAADPEACLRFVRAAHVTAYLEHPNIITIHEMGDHDGIRFIVLPALDGETLSEAMSRGLSLREGLSVIQQVLSALAFMHERGIVHRNVNPEGIFVCVDGAAKLTDLGSTWVMPPVSGEAAPAASSKSPPERVAPRPDARSDQFSVGCLLYQMVAGRTPFQGDTPAEVLYRVVTAEPDMGLIPAGSQWECLRRVILRALQKSPEDRYPHAIAMLSDLQLALAGLGDSADWTPSSGAASSAPQPN